MLVSRNAQFIDTKLQSQLKAKRIFFAGCGLGSNIALLAARAGFSKFVIADFDKVELSNLNRQAFTRNHLQRNKASALRNVLLEIHPDAEVEYVSYELNPSNVNDFIDRSDLIVNTVDFDATCYAIQDKAISQGKPVLFPLNIGFGGLLLIFTEQTIRLQQMTDKATGNANFLKALSKSIKGYDIPEYVAPALAALDKYDEAGFLPQTGIAANITASLAVTAMIGCIAGWPLRFAPYAISADALLSGSI